MNRQPTSKTLLLAPLLGVLVALMAAASVAGATPLAGPAGPAAAVQDASGYVPGQVIVKFKPGVSARSRAASLNATDTHALRSLPLPGVQVLGLPRGDSVTAAVAALEHDPQVAWAEPNSVGEAGSLPNDPLLAQQRALHNTGQAVDGVAGTAGVDIRAPEAWDRTTGSPDVKVAVIDSGINLAEPDLAPNIWRNPGESGNGRESNGIDDDHDGYVDDWRGWDFFQNDDDPSDNNGHGTHVAGIIGARGNNGIGVAGVALNTSLIPLRVMGTTGKSSCAMEAAAEAYAGKIGARVANVSIWSPHPCKAEEEAIASFPNTLFVVIAGNDHGVDVDASPRYPCADPEPNVVCVTATGRTTSSPALPTTTRAPLISARPESASSAATSSGSLSRRFSPRGSSLPSQVAGSPAARAPGPSRRSSRTAARGASPTRPAATTRTTQTAMRSSTAST